MGIRYLMWAGALTFTLSLVAAIRGNDPPTPAKPVELPLTRVVLFNAGVGYFQREGVVDGNARVEMRFPEPDVNDLLKSLILEDKDGGKVKAITYDGKHPIEVTLKSFAIDVTSNPSIGDLLIQVRGEKVEITDNKGTTLSGVIVGVDRPGTITTTTQTTKGGETTNSTTTAPGNSGETLNLLTADGLQSVPLAQVKKIKLLKAELEVEFRKALEILAAARGTSKKAININFEGNGRRRVKVGYVMESPMWKANYRLSLNEKTAANLQGWAIVENTTEEDWNNVKIGLVAGRPMAFQMDLYQPLFVPRPMVELELYASLRPPVYQGNVGPVGFGGIGGGFGGGGFGGAQLGAGAANNLGAGGGLVGFGGGQVGQFGGQIGRPSTRELLGPRLSYDDLKERVLDGKNPDRAKTQIALMKDQERDDATTRATVLSAAAAVAMNDTFEYKIEDLVTLPRLKSALLPIVNDPIETKRVSIYNSAVLGKHPLVGVRLTNKTKLNLAQGPITVYDGDTFAGDARLPDLAPGESRLISFAVDLHTEIVPRTQEPKKAVEMVSFVGGKLFTRELSRQSTQYQIRNRGTKDRLIVVEHRIHEGWKLAKNMKPTETTRAYHRFEMVAKADSSTVLDVEEELSIVEDRFVKNVNSDSLRFYSAMAVASPAVKEAGAKILAMRATAEATMKAKNDEDAALKAIGEDQTRIRANLERVPKDSEAYKRYLKKFDDQETEIETRQSKAMQLLAKLVTDEKEYQEFLAKLKAE